MEIPISYGEDYKYIPVTSTNSGRGVEILSDIYAYTIQVVNICFVGNAGDKDFVLVDTGMPKSAEKIISVTEDRFGSGSRPKAIVLTHGHFDHVGGVVDLVKQWDIPVYAHELELPYVTGELSYPKPDATVEGGLVAKMSPMFPTAPIHLGSYIRALPDDGSIPHMPGFRWIHTPGHSPGHVSLFREEDRTLIAGDAFITVRQDELYKVLTQEEEINGPPRYLTTDWNAARESVTKLQTLKPAVAVTGHGTPLTGDTLLNGLEKLVAEFDDVAIPDRGKFIN